MPLSQLKASLKSASGKPLSLQTWACWSWAGLLLAELPAPADPQATSGFRFETFAASALAVV